MIGQGWPPPCWGSGQGGPGPISDTVLFVIQFEL